ncbi:type VI secretion system ATPase TssH [Fodinicurvata sp. EGI_FJ10296]|uniref:type VI secretion system ATPase TssH n=1 Tax=Fodinicurvata sp. EGI_FJ10296 TaxID=3231908 RepID=UPI00345706AA
MVAVDLQSMVGWLNPLCKKTLESAVGLTMSRTHFNAELEHWLLRILEEKDTDADAILRHFEIDRDQVVSDLNRVLDKLKTGNSRPPALSPNMVKLMKEAWLLGSLQYGERKIRSGHLLVALLADETLAPLARDASRQFDAIPADTLRKHFPSITGSTAEASASEAENAAASAAPGGGAPRAAGGGKTPNLDQFTIDVTEEARAGKIDPILGRDMEVRQVIDILTRRRQNNPLLAGEAGVGKTAVVEGFALRIAEGDVPDVLKDVAVKSLDMTLLQAGAGMKGEFENRLKNVINEVESSAKPIILFIDEAHSLVGAGGQAGQGDAANILKPALARGQLRTIAATTWAEYKKYFERDAALTRRFQVVKVDEPSEKVAVDMMRGLAPVLEKHHGVRIMTEAVVEAVRLSSRYIPARQLPDKSVSLLDTACARVSMSLATTPEPIESRQRELETLASEATVLRRESATGSNHAERLAELTDRQQAIETELTDLNERWARERDLIDRIRDLMGQIEEKVESANGGPDDADDLRTQLATIEAELEDLQGDTPLLKGRVDAQAIAEVVANWTGIPVGRMASNEIRTVLSLKERMEERVIGQPHALEAITETLWTARAKLTDPRKPIGVFMMVGTSGVGKTETALALAELMYGGEQNITTINMSEFKEEHKVSMLVGSPPGYVGYGEGGVLTEAVRRRPYSVILLDEVEKAHPGVQDIFYQVFDKGMLRDGEGRDIDFKNTVIIMTSNAGTDVIHSLCADPETIPDAAGLTEALRPELLKIFKPAFLGRTTLVPYFPLSDDIIRKIIVLQLSRIEKRVHENYKASFTYSDDLVQNVADRCNEVESGARNIEQVLTRGLLPELSSEVLRRIADGTTFSGIHVSLDSNGEFAYQFT